MKKNKFLMWTLRILSICIIIIASVGMFYFAKSALGYMIAIVVTLDLIYLWNHFALKKLSK